MDVKTFKVYFIISQLTSNLKVQRNRFFFFLLIWTEDPGIILSVGNGSYAHIQLIIVWFTDLKRKRQMICTIVSATKGKPWLYFVITNHLKKHLTTRLLFFAVNLFCWCLNGLIGPTAVHYMLTALWKKLQPTEIHLATQITSANWHSNKAEKAAVCCNDWWSNMKSSLPFPIVWLFNQT